MKPKKKITLHLPADLLSASQKISKKGITPTITEALESMIARDAYEQLLALRGKIKTSINFADLRKD